MKLVTRFTLLGFSHCLSSETSNAIAPRRYVIIIYKTPSTGHCTQCPYTRHLVDMQIHTHGTFTLLCFLTTILNFARILKSQNQSVVNAFLLCKNILPTYREVGFSFIYANVVFILKFYNKILK